MTEGFKKAQRRIQKLLLGGILVKLCEQKFCRRVKNRDTEMLLASRRGRAKAKKILT